MDEIKTTSFVFSGPVERRVQEKDIPALINLFKLNYGADYAHPDLYNDRRVKHDIYNDDMIWLVSEDDSKDGAREIVASGALVIAGDENDQMGEIGRLVVHPERKGRGLARRIVNALLRATEGTIEFAFALARTVHPISQMLMENSDYPVVGFVPHYYEMGKQREGFVLYANLYGNGRELRCAAPPQIIPEVEALARHALAAMNLPESVNIIERVTPYPVESRFDLKSMDRGSMVPLLRLKHGQSLEPLMFGRLSIEQGIQRIRRGNAYYFMAVNEAGQPLGALGYQVDHAHMLVKGIELIAEDEKIRGQLCRALVDEAQNEWNAQVVEVDVSAYDARLQQTFYELGFRPAVYAPAMVFHGTDRLDVVKMLKLNFPYVSSEMKLTEAAREVVAVVEQGFDNVS